MRRSKSSSQREPCADTGLPQETRKSSNKQPILPSTGTRKRKRKPKVGRRKEIIKVREEIKEIPKTSIKKHWVFKRINQIHKVFKKSLFYFGV